MKAYIVDDKKGIVLIGNKAYQPSTGTTTNTYYKWSLSQLQTDRVFKVKQADLNTAFKLLQNFRIKRSNKNGKKKNNNKK